MKFEQKNYAAAGSIAEEVLAAIRTVAAFGGENREVDRLATHWLVLDVLCASNVSLLLQVRQGTEEGSEGWLHQVTDHWYLDGFAVLRLVRLLCSGVWVCCHSHL